MALSFDNEFESLFAQSPLFEGPDSPNCDVIIDDVPFCNSLLEPDNFLLSDVTQGKIAKKSPFHESDSGISENMGSPADSEVMMDGELNDEPFFNGADKDLLDYFGGGSSSDEEVTFTTKLRSRNKENVDGNKNSVNAESKSYGRVVSKGKAKIVPVRNVTPTTRKWEPTVEISLMSDSNNNLSKSNTPSNVKPKQPTVELSLIHDGVPTSNIQSVRVVKVIKTSVGDDASDACEVVKALEEKSKKNAQQARANREKKKAYMQGLETDIKKLQTENGDLKTENKMLTCRTKALEEEVEYLKCVLANESALSKLLKNIDSVKGVRLTTSFRSRKHSATLDHCYESPSKQSKLSTAGICLHVDKDDVSLEFCSHCSQMAKIGENQ